MYFGTSSARGITAASQLKRGCYSRIFTEKRSRQNKESGWDETMEPLKCPETDACRKKFNEDKEKMRLKQMEDEIRARINEENKRSSEHAARENQAFLAKQGKEPIPLSKLNDDEAKVRVDSLILQIDALTKDPMAIRADVLNVFLREKMRLQRDEAPTPSTKMLTQKMTEEARKTRQTQQEVMKAFQSFKREHGFARPQSPPMRERSRGHSREHERTYDRRNERSHEHYRERTRDYRKERSRERSNDRHYRGGRGWVRHGNEITETGIQRRSTRRRSCRRHENAKKKEEKKCSGQSLKNKVIRCRWESRSATVTSEWTHPKGHVTADARTRGGEVQLHMIKVGKRKPHISLDSNRRKGHQAESGKIHHRNISGCIRQFT
ncbi:pre-mRNA-splicing factor 38B-like [Paramacrobiotus metropolitanus]|uniref:pre-mRNA-splicing factor 38B-like n=1 Tax=Paramacrobiotus metropolitanus TaxID=2943436 RepID=UPI00244654E9|nr:pre-mRNA-splicing factor 38B-like [Paramacrobiotus metropolitanus]